MGLTPEQQQALIVECSECQEQTTIFEATQRRFQRGRCGNCGNKLVAIKVDDEPSPEPSAAASAEPPPEPVEAISPVKATAVPPAPEKPSEEPFLTVTERVVIADRLLTQGYRASDLAADYGVEVTTIERVVEEFRVWCPKCLSCNGSGRDASVYVDG